MNKHQQMCRDLNNAIQIGLDSSKRKLKMTEQTVAEYYDIYLDDVREFCAGNTMLIRNYNQFVETIEKNGLPRSISFDHDLGKKSRDGQDCAEWLVNYCIRNRKALPLWSIHSGNPVGMKEICSVLETFEKYFKFN